MSVKYELTTERLRTLFIGAYAWRFEDDLEAGESDLSYVREEQTAQFDRWLEAHDREIREGLFADDVLGRGGKALAELVDRDPFENAPKAWRYLFWSILTKALTPPEPKQEATS